MNRTSRNLIVVISGMLVALALGACGPGEGDGPKLAPASRLREDIRRQPPVVREAYQFALANPDVLRQIPCYCGCGAGHGGDAHKSVKDCFVREVKPDGTVVWDDMGKGCSICVDIVRDTMRLTEEGKPLAEVRSYIDQTYSRFGPSTDTEPVSP